MRTTIDIVGLAMILARDLIAQTTSLARAAWAFSI
jgi:hypothetical protein